jgi:hypothetical protein
MNGRALDVYDYTDSDERGYTSYKHTDDDDYYEDDEYMNQPKNHTISSIRMDSGERAQEPFMPFSPAMYRPYQSNEYHQAAHEGSRARGRGRGRGSIHQRKNPLWSVLQDVMPDYTGKAAR